jgi:putative PIN family toxin of toxin-antitoxin system
MRIVIDTNVLISATFWTGNPKQLLNKVRRGEVTFITSETLLEELKEVLTREDKPFLSFQKKKQSGLLQRCETSLKLSRLKVT